MINSSYYQQHRAEILQLIQVPPLRILDIGCGKGGVAAMLRGRFNKVWISGFDKYKDEAFDYSTLFDSFHNVDLSGDWPDIDYTTFDLILLLDVLEHLTDPDVVLAKLARSVAPDARVIVSLPNFHAYGNLYQIIKTGRFKYEDSGTLDRTHLRFYGQQDARELIEAHFEVEAFLPHHLQPRSTLNRVAATLLGEKYAAYQNIFLCRPKAP
jgi:2-polyprenyl-3-methyl-5-hydroxy-6-metoxy-1,4-benzoquinol methylase